MTSDKLQVLVVDDSDIVRRAIRTLLQESEQFSVHDCESADGAFEKARKVKPQVILLDMSLPGVPGTALGPQLRDEFPEAKVVLMSAQDGTVLAKLTELAGLRWSIPKSELSAELVPLLEKITSN